LSPITVYAWNPPRYPRVNYILDILRQHYHLVTIELRSIPNRIAWKKVRKARHLLLLFYFIENWVKTKPNVLIVFSPVNFAILGVILGKIFKIPIIFDLYYSWVESNIDIGVWSRGSIKAKAGAFIEKLALRSSNLVFVDTSESREYYSHTYNIEKTKIIPIYGVVDLKKFDPAINGKEIKTRYGLGKAFVIMYHGTFHYVHGIRYIIKAIPLVIKETSNVKFLFVGYGPAYNECKFLAKSLGVLGNYAIFTGSVAHDLLPDYLAASDLWLGLFSSSEKAQRTARFGMFEAMAMKKPIVTAKTREVERIIIDGYNGFLVKPENEQNIADIIIKLSIDEESRRKVGENARKYVEEQYNLTVLHKILESCIEKMVNCNLS